MYKEIIRPILFSFEPETIHNITIEGLSTVSRIPGVPQLAHALMKYRNPILESNHWGMNFPHPIGLSAGLDKYGSAYQAWQMFDFSFAEIGSVTYSPQPGNAKPRVWRIKERESLQVNFGLNSVGAAETYKKLSGHTSYGNCKIGVSIARTTNIPEEKSAEDYVKTFKVLYPVADYITLNVSCPNVCDFTDLQRVSFMQELLHKVTTVNNELPHKKTIFVKIGPDMDETSLKELLDVILQYKIDGVIATNLLKNYPQDKILPGKGGLSGQFVQKQSTETIRTIYRHTGGALKIIGLGGVYSGLDALEKIKAGASLLQIYTSFIYRGPFAVRLIAKELAEALEKEGFNHYTEAIGVDAK